VLTAGNRSDLARHALTGAILGTLCAVAMYLLGVQQLLRRPDLSLFLALTIVGALLGMSRLRPLLWVAGGILTVLCLAVAYTPLAAHSSAPFIRRDSIPSRVDAIAVLSIGGTPDGLMRSETLDRVLTGIALSRGGLSQNMMISRETRAFGGKNVSDSADLAAITGMAAPQASVEFVDSIRTTRTEALRMLRIARPRGWSTVAVVTSPLHSRRACATFEAVGFRVVCVPADARDSGLPKGSIGADRLRAFQSWLYETFASSSYRRRGWIR